MRLRPIRWLILFAALCLFRPASAQEANHIKDVVYGHKMGVALTFDVFKPEKPNGIGVIWMVSGGWVSNHNNISPVVAKPFTDKGQTVFEVVHGSQPKFTLPEIIQDIHRAVRFIRTHASEYGVDPNRLGISGGSAGGHLSLMMGAYGGPGDPNAKDPIDRASSSVNAIACLFPPTDFMNYGKEGVKAFEIPALRPFRPAFGVTDQTPVDQMEAMGKTLSPIYGALDKMPPTMIVHGDADTLVPLQQSERFMAKLEENKIPHRLEVRPGKGHGFWPGIEKDFTLMAEWFEKYMPEKK